MLKLLATLRRSLGLRRRRYLLASLLFALEGLLLTLVSGALYRGVIRIIEDKSPDRSSILFLFLVLAVLGIAALARSAEYGILRGGSASEKQLRSAVVRRLLSLPLPERERRSLDRELNLLARDIRTFGRAGREFVPLLLKMIVAAVFGLILTAFFNPLLALFALLAGLLYLLCARSLKGRLAAAYRADREAFAELAALSAESLRGLSTLRFYSMEKPFAARLEAARQRYEAAGRRHQRLAVLETFLSNLGYSFAYVGSLAFALQLVSRGRIALSDAMFIWPTAMQASYAIQKYGSVLLQCREPLAAHERIEDVLALRGEDLLRGEVDPVWDESAPLIEIRDLSFRYPGNERYIFKDFSLRIERGDQLAVLGASGSGKSTLFKLLLGFYPYEEGEILLRGVPLPGIALTTLRAQFCYVPQFPSLFEGSLRENLRLLAGDKLDEVMQRALRRACLHQLEGREQEDLLDAEMGEAGRQVSGGERQRIALARAYLRRAPIYLLDEMTSALDAAVEAEVMKKLVADEEATLLWITHRAQSAAYAGRILRLDER